MWLLNLFIASASAEEAASIGAGMPLFEKGLIVTAGGLLGVFLVLCLFFLTIKIMQRFK